MNFGRTIGIIPTALPKFVNAQDSNPPSPRPSPPLSRGERAGSGGILHAQEFVNSGSAIGISLACVFVRFGAAIGISSVFERVCL
jgi:hypothetical protein